ncbi:hypothetical protein LCGC14_2800940 [marine sediment metagenome]|uniref:Uncharacterized protein n=1 Tax=marine sediment metagenome TaxID=412755 RepID=A0A0F9AW54_9ZZZZ
MRTHTIIALLLVALGLWGMFGGAPSPGPGPEPHPNPIIPKPSREAARAVEPIATLLAGHSIEARQLAAFYHAAAEVIRRDGDGGKVVKTTADFRTFCQRVVTLRFQATFRNVSGLADAIHGPQGALPKLLKLDVADLDHRKAADALDAVAWACQEASRG